MLSWYIVIHYKFSEKVNTLVAIATICGENNTKFNIYISFLEGIPLL